MDKNKEHSLIEVVDKKQLKLSSRRSLGKYRLQKRLGKGGYCEVWKARDTVEGIWVALKIPIPDVAGERDNETVLREVRLVAQLKHPHIMPVKNADVIEHHAVLATELSTGTLEDCYRPMGVRRIISKCWTDFPMHIKNELSTAM
jgi:serine/threonine protein kinase